MVDLATRIVAGLSRLLYRIFLLLPQKQKIVFMSRQSARPLDFVLLEPALQERFQGYDIKWLCVHKIGRMNIGLYLQQLWHTATAKLCIIDGYVPAVCVCAGLHRAKCVQMWHALGAIKKFGKQTLDTPAGHSSVVARNLRMHQGYDVIVAGLSSSKKAFAQAFGYPENKIVALGLPRIDYIKQRQKLFDEGVLQQSVEQKHEQLFEQLQAAYQDGYKIVLYAPTFRKGGNFPNNWLEQNVAKLTEAFASTQEKVKLLVAAHPLQILEDQHAGVSDIVLYTNGAPTIDVLCYASAVVTDYSAVAFEAVISSKPVYFYVPDIQAYRESVGLNIDPFEQFPQATFTDAEALAKAVLEPATYNCFTSSEQLTNFCLIPGRLQDLTPEVANFIKQLVE